MFLHLEGIDMNVLAQFVLELSLWFVLIMNLEILQKDKAYKDIEGET